MPLRWRYTYPCHFLQEVSDSLRYMLAPGSAINELVHPKLLKLFSMFDRLVEEKLGYERQDDVPLSRS